MSFNRRNFLRGFSGAVGLSAVAMLGRRFSLFEREASAATVGHYAGYRALVNVFLVGGNDSNNMVIPYQVTGTPNYGEYTAVRSSPAALQIEKTNATGTGIDDVGTWLGPQATAVYALHPSMPKTAALFNGATSPNGPNDNVSPDGVKSVAIVFNVGTLVQPTTLAQAQALIGSGGTGEPPVQLPDQLFSHINQQAEWSTAITDPSYFFANASQAQLAMQNTGWGGRTADLFVSFNPTVKVGSSSLPFPSLSYYAGPAVFGQGEQLSALSITAAGTLALNSSGSTAVNNLIQGNASLGITGALPEMTSVVSGVAPIDAFSAGMGQALDYASFRTAARAANPLPTAISALFPTSLIGQQLLHITQDIVAGASAVTSGGLGLRREIFAAGFGSFDTHSNQLAEQATLLGELDDALFAFYSAIYQLNLLVANGTLPGVTMPLEVTLFTQSEFTRTFLPNSTSGSDHAWGGHQLVLGNQVKGGTYGAFPDLTLDGKSDVGEGRWLPTISSDEYQNTLAVWLGIVDSTDEATVFPNLASFPKASVGFMNV
jgi:uncharacterized protein (DUF1501 family)